MMQIIYTLLLLFAPVPLLIVWGRIKVLRQRAAEDDALQPKPFAPKPEPTPGFLLRRFPLPERTYLRQQLGTAKVGFCIAAWSTTVLMSTTLLPGGADNPYDWPADAPALLWNNYLQSAVLMSIFGCMMALITVMTAGFGITATGPGMMNRTRPITHRLLFWGRVGPALLTLFSAYATGIAISLMLLYVLHGPVWSQLNDSQGFQLTVKQLHRIAWMQNISPPRMLLSVFTTSSMIFSAFLLLQQLPLNRVRVPKLLVFFLSLLTTYLFIHQLLPVLLPRISGLFFIYSPTTTAPPPWSAALVPIGITAALLTLSQLLNRRSEP